MAARDRIEVVDLEGDRRGLVTRCRGVLEREGYHVVAVARRRNRGGTGPDLMATNSAHTMRVHVVTMEEIDGEPTRSRLLNSAERGETRVFVEWPLRWRMVSNLARWGITGVAVGTW